MMQFYYIILKFLSRLNPLWNASRKNIWREFVWLESVAECERVVLITILYNLCVWLVYSVPIFVLLL